MKTPTNCWYIYPTKNPTIDPWIPAPRPRFARFGAGVAPGGAVGWPCHGPPTIPRRVFDNSWGALLFFERLKIEQFEPWQLGKIVFRNHNDRTVDAILPMKGFSYFFGGVAIRTASLCLGRSRLLVPGERRRLGSRIPNRGSRGRAFFFGGEGLIQIL